MNDDVLYEVIKYMDFPVENERITELQSNNTNSKRMMRLNRNILEKKLSNRPTIDDLRVSNIYKEDNGVDFDKIHAELSSVFYKRGAPPFFSTSSKLACAARTMDFKLKKVLLVFKLKLYGGEDRQ